MKLCECGCGQPTANAKANNKRKGHIKGQPLRFINGHNARGVPKSPETRAKMKEAWAGVPRPWLRGPRPGAWNDGDPGYATAHLFLRTHYPKTKRCEQCGRNGWTDYAFLRHPLPYTRLREDYAELCRSCHMRMDYANGIRTSNPR